MRGAFVGGQTERSSFDISSNLALVSAVIRAVAALAASAAGPVERFAQVVVRALPVVAPLVMNDCAMLRACRARTARTPFGPSAEPTDAPERRHRVAPTATIRRGALTNH